MQGKCAATTAELLLGSTKATVRKLRISFTPTLEPRPLTETRSLARICFQELCKPHFYLSFPNLLVGRPTSTTLFGFGVLGLLLLSTTICGTHA